MLTFEDFKTCIAIYPFSSDLFSYFAINPLVPSIVGSVRRCVLIQCRFTWLLSLQNSNEDVSDGWFPASEADKRDKFQQDLAENAGLLPISTYRFVKVALRLLLHNR